MAAPAIWQARCSSRAPASSPCTSPTTAAIRRNWRCCPGQVDFNFDNLATAAPNIRAGKLKALAVTTLNRSPALPDVPPVADTLKGFAIDTWWGLVAPAGTPRDVITKLNHAFVAALQSAEVKSRFAGLLAEPVPSSPEEFGEFHEGRAV